MIYGITGGVPHYINKLDVRDSVDEALLDNFFDRSSYLYEEPGNLLKQKLREPAIYNAIIKAIAEGASRMNDIHIVCSLNKHRKEREKRLREQLFSSISMYGVGIFISYHYDSDNKIAREITEIINTDKINIFTVVKENEKKKDAEIIKNWVDEEIKKTRITILLISSKTLEREYVSYELSKSVLNGNSIIPILIDSKQNGFTKESINLVKQKLNLELSGKRVRIRKWFQDNGKENILRWLNEMLEEREN